MKTPPPTKEEIAKTIEAEVQNNIPLAKEVLHHNLYKFNKLIFFF